MKITSFLKNIVFSFLLLTFLFVLTACGGGGDEGSNGGNQNNNSPDANVVINISSQDINKTLSTGDMFPFTISGTWIETGGVQASQIFLAVQNGSGEFTLPQATNPLSDGSFSTTIKASSHLNAGTYVGSIGIVACKDASCTEQYSGTSGSLNFTLNINKVAEWEMHQRNAKHNGYVPIYLEPSLFQEVWQWSREQDGEPIGGINAVVTQENKVYVTKDVYFGQGVLYSLNEGDGSEAWRVSFGQVPALNPPAVGNGQVYSAVTGHEQTELWVFNSTTGAFLHKSTFSGQWPHVLAPTIHNNQVITAGGYFGGENYAYSTVDGSANWTHSSGGVWDMYTPAVDDKYAYHHNGANLFIIDSVNGTTVNSIPDPFGANTGYSYHAAPIIGGRNNIISYAGGAFSGRASSNVEQYDHRVLSSFNLNTNSYEWATPFSYLTVPAIANGVIYAGRNSPMSFDAIDETTGQILWSWSTNQNGDTEFHRNVIVTSNLIFVSTNSAIYALDIVTGSPVWSYPQPGMMAISSNRTLYIATGASESDGNLIAIRLQ